jgi:hypothetical protein
MAHYGCEFLQAIFYYMYLKARFINPAILSISVFITLEVLYLAVNMCDVDCSVTSVAIQTIKT